MAKMRPQIAYEGFFFFCLVGFASEGFGEKWDYERISSQENSSYSQFRINKGWGRGLSGVEGG